MKSKLFRYELKPTNQFVEVPLVYVLLTTFQVKLTYLVMEETFEALEISPKTFVKFLNKKLDVKDPRYQDCKELWESNLPLDQSAETFIDIKSKISRSNIIKILTADDFTK